jgi:hypothetical protein
MTESFQHFIHNQFTGHRRRKSNTVLKCIQEFIPTFIYQGNLVSIDVQIPLQIPATARARRRDLHSSAQPLARVSTGCPRARRSVAALVRGNGPRRSRRPDARASSRRRCSGRARPARPYGCGSSGTLATAAPMSSSSRSTHGPTGSPSRCNGSGRIRTDTDSREPRGNDRSLAAGMPQLRGRRSWGRRHLRAEVEVAGHDDQLGQQTATAAE